MNMENNDIHKHILDLVQNESFIHWVKSDFIDNDDEWSTFIDENIEEMDDINEAIKIVSSLSFENQSTINIDGVWGRIKSDIGQEIESDRNNIRTLFGLKSKVALLAAACFAAFFFFRPSIGEMKNVTTGIGEEITEVLPDGSEVRLNSESNLVYDLENWDSKRQIKMSGVAFFEVKKGSKFTVESDKGTVEVLGTSFNVNTRGQLFEVVCKTGKVLVTDSSKKSNLTLEPGDESHFIDGNLKLINNPGIVQVPWLEGVYTFNNKPLAEVLEEIERQFPFKCKLSDEHSKLKYTGFFKKKDLNDALFAITWPLGLKYRIEGNVIFITDEK
jgi:ferric-dicitrate binding protein FerR (iron transport regulator)